MWQITWHAQQPNPHCAHIALNKWIEWPAWDNRLLFFGYGSCWMTSPTLSCRQTPKVMTESKLGHAVGVFLAPWTLPQGPDQGLSYWQVLLVSSSRHPDQWIVPGGGMEPKEEPCGAAVREVYEEVSSSTEKNRHRHHVTALILLCVGTTLATSKTYP